MNALGDGHSVCLGMGKVRELVDERDIYGVLLCTGLDAWFSILLQVLQHYNNQRSPEYDMCWIR